MLKPFESVSNNPSVYSVDSMLQVRLKITDRLHSTANYRRNDMILITTGTRIENRGAFQITDFDKMNFSDMLSRDIPKIILMAGRFTCLRKIEMHPHGVILE